LPTADNKGHCHSIPTQDTPADRPSTDFIPDGEAGTAFSRSTANRKSVKSLEQAKLVSRRLGHVEEDELGNISALRPDRLSVGL